MGRNQASWRGGRFKKTYNVKTYHCKECGHIFHHTNPDFTKCRHCQGELEIIDRYKSGKVPRGSPSKGKSWQVKGGADKQRLREQPTRADL